MPVLTFRRYQEEARKTAIYPDKGHNYIYPTLGISGEAGELAEKIKKVLRDKKGIIDEESLEAIKKEMGDILWYLANLATELGIQLEQVALLNLEKLASRQQRNRLHGEGDDR